MLKSTPISFKNLEREAFVVSLNPLAFKESLIYALAFSSYKKNPFFCLALTIILFWYWFLNWLATFDKCASPTETSPFSNTVTFLTAELYFLNVLKNAVNNCAECVVFILDRSAGPSSTDLFVRRSYNAL